MHHCLQCYLIALALNNNSVCSFFLPFLLSTPLKEDKCFATLNTFPKKNNQKVIFFLANNKLKLKKL